MSLEMLAEFKSLRKMQNQKQTVSIRLSPETLSKARTYGKGYTAFLSRLLDLAINDAELVKRCV